MAAKFGLTNIAIVAGVILIILVGISWYHKRIMEGFQGASNLKNAFEKFTDDQKLAVCATMSDQLKTFNEQLASAQASQALDITNSIKQIEELTKSYGC